MPAGSTETFEVILDRPTLPCNLASVQIGVRRKNSGTVSWDLDKIWIRALGRGVNRLFQPYAYHHFDSALDFEEYHLDGGECDDPGDEEQPELTSEFQIRLRTGPDDLRGNTDNIDMRLWLTTGEQIDVPNINRSEPFPQDREREFSVFLPKAVTVCELDRVELRATFGNQSAPETGDNWDMVYMTILSDIHVLANLGSHRFTGEAPNFSAQLSPPDCPDPLDIPDDLPPVVTPPTPACTPYDRAYCFEMGVCNPEGTRCVCDEPANRWSSERCAVWHPTPPPPPTAACTPGDRAYCHWKGQCAADATGCVCDHPNNWWASDRCDIWHDGPDVAVGPVCRPGSRADCAWVGACNNFGTACVCDDPDHNWASELCRGWHPYPE